MKIFTIKTYSHPFIVFKPRNTPAHRATMWDYLSFTSWGFGYTWIEERSENEL